MEVYVVNSKSKCLVIICSYLYKLIRLFWPKIDVCVHLFVYVLIVLINRLVILSMGNAITLAGGISENSLNGLFSNFRFPEFEEFICNVFNVFEDLAS